MGQSLSGNLYLRGYHKALGTKQLYTVGTVDQHPKSLANALLYGTQFSVAVPDLDRTDHLLLLGANPVVSQGSLVAAPDIRTRLRAIRERGGRIVVIDPRRTRTAREADEHHFVRPGTDAFLLAALAATLFEEGLVAPGRLEEHVSGLDAVRDFCLRFPPERVAERCGIEATVVRRLARDLAAAERAVVYGRCGTTMQAFGTAASWLVDVLNVLTGNLDRPGGAMFATPCDGRPDVQRPAAHRARHRARPLALPRRRASPRCSGSSRSACSPRRSRRRGRGGCARSSRSRGTPSSRARTARGSARPLRPSTASSRSTRTSTRRRVTRT